jgi:hypothetical protein
MLRRDSKSSAGYKKKPSVTLLGVNNDCMHVAATAQPRPPRRRLAAHPDDSLVRYFRQKSLREKEK